MKINYSQMTILLVTTFTVVLLTASHVRAQATTSINVTELSITPSTIDTTSSTQDVTITVHVTDTERDISVVYLYFRSPLRVRELAAFVAEDRISGTARDAVFRKTYTIWRYAEAGIWIIDNIYVIDGTPPNNRWSVLNTAYLAARGLLIQLQVINNNEADPPEISDFNITLSTINGSRNVTVTLRAKDTGSGIGTLSVFFSKPAFCDGYLDDDCTWIGFGFGSANRISGDNNDGVYRRSFDISPDIPPGIYGAAAGATDRVNNSTWVLYPAEIYLSAPSFVGISGRVLTPDGSGLRNAAVTLTDSQGEVRTVTTSSFGFYSFDNVATGSSYTIAVSSRRYRYASRTLEINSSLTGVDFVGLE